MKYSTSLCPKHDTMHSWLYRVTKMKDNLIDTDLKNVSVKLNYDLDLLQSSVNDILKKYNPVGWQTKEKSLNHYKSLSLRSNPNHQDNLDENYNSIGTPKNKIGEFFYNQTQNHTYLKDSYYDTYGFITPTSCSLEGELGKFLSTIKRTIVRSRISTIVASEQPDDPRVGWHRDEEIFINLRLNIPITSSEEFYFEMENTEPYNLKLGNLYSWDTNIAHRVFANRPTDNTRTNLVIGCSPWFDYIPEEQVWIKNEFFGKKHPFNMLLDGDILPKEFIGN
jgi:hypothetical protein